MSTQIATIEGKEQNFVLPSESYNSILTIHRENDKLTIIIGIHPNVAHIQLNKEQIEQLKTILNNWEETPEIE